MIDVFTEAAFNTYYTRGYIDPGIDLPPALVEEMRQHYGGQPDTRNDYPQYYKKNEHQAWLEGRVVGLISTLMPRYSERMVEKLYGESYNRAVHGEQVFIQRLVTHMLEQGFGRLFRTRYLVASYDIYLGNDHLHRSFTDIHSDIPNFHHFYETESDITIYVPLVDVNAANGGRLAILPEARSKLKVPGNVLLKILEQHFLARPHCLDANGYIDPDRIGQADMDSFIKGRPYQDLMQNYKTSTALARTYYGDEFVMADWAKGRPVIFTNKNFHAAESWRNENMHREIYMLRLLPVYDCRIRLKDKLHGRLFNHHLIDTREGVVHRFDEAVDFSRIPAEDKLELHARPVARATRPAATAAA
ncbi:MAG TPA: hypothetical protein VIL30_00805 [Ramlibacter sp.]|jgi:ectoine hydroxylase-related dioxygenase (phytanoyl-CoA dioxygenase family)